MYINGSMWDLYSNKLEEACELAPLHICAALHFRPIINRSVASMNEELDNILSS